ncbi:MAG TPA: hypothetical protein VFB21_16145 [Chthonomonadaceae bacterium]|nr:hypothetical protein [Chthonomonadaceae bacterium]
MSDYRMTAERLRGEAGVSASLSIEAETLLPRLYPVTCEMLPGLCVSTLRDTLLRHRIALPPALTLCRDRRLRGGILAWHGHGFLFADAEDSPAERRFTFAHEAAHFLQEHLYPRLDLLDRFGESLRPVLDGRRPLTLAERVDALLARTTLTLHTHLLEREEESRAEEVSAIEASADAFACELLAPRAALLARFPSLIASEESVAEVQAILIADFALPPAPALRYARRFVAEHGQSASLLARLGLS